MIKSKCWIAKGHRMKSGYVIVYKGGERFYAHRLSYKMSFGEIPKGIYVCHKCDNPPCYRPSHLFLGTQKDNLQDMVKKGRAAFGDRNGARTHPDKHIKGEKHVNAKLNLNDVVNIRKYYSEKKFNIYELAKKYKVSAATISLTINKKRYANI